MAAARKEASRSGKPMQKAKKKKLEEEAKKKKLEE